MRVRPAVICASAAEAGAESGGAFPGLLADWQDFLKIEPLREAAGKELRDRFEAVVIVLGYPWGLRHHDVHASVPKQVPQVVIVVYGHKVCARGVPVRSRVVVAMVVIVLVVESERNPMHDPSTPSPHRRRIPKERKDLSRKVRLHEPGNRRLRMIGAVWGNEKDVWVGVDGGWIL
ncbi:hypothetical protein BDZ91DRAFT_409114 [Kalaharituber pfeilii]|nr:hypothetical protein BDZ91DRAFT_409114 [Kalaharituber pfeilii]